MPTLTVLWLLGLLASGLAGAQTLEIATQIKVEQQQLILVRNQLKLNTNIEADKNRLATVSAAGMQTLGAVLNALQGSIEDTLGQLRGAIPKATVRDPLFPFSWEDGELLPLRRARVLSNDAAPTLQLFALSVLNVRLVGDWLSFAHASAVAKGMSRLDSGDFLVIQGQLKQALATAKRFFPELPEFPFSEKSEGEARRFPLDKLRSLFALFSPQPEGEWPSQSVGQQLMEGLGGIEQTVLLTDEYLLFYPQQGNEASLKHFAAAIEQTSGLHECLNLANGVGDFEGAPCDLVSFRRHLTDYLKFYDEHQAAHSGLLSVVLEYMASFKESEGSQPGRARWDTLARDLTWHVEHSKFGANVINKWPRIRENLFANT